MQDKDGAEVDIVPGQNEHVAGSGINAATMRRHCMNPEEVIENLVSELNGALQGMSKAKTVEEKVLHSQIVKNMCDSLGVFFGLASNMMENDLDYSDDDE